MNRPPPLPLRSLATALTVIAAGIAHASPGLSEQEYFEELPVVLSVSRLAQPTAEAPGAVTVIDREMIRQSGARQMVDLLRLVPGFQVASAPYGMTTSVYHGLTEAYPRHMQVLIDGRSQYSPFFVGGVNWALIPVSIDDIDRIEVVRGANSAAYGSNAVLGVVNIITRHAQDAQGVSAELHSGNGINDSRLRAGAVGRDVALRVTAETRRDTGLDNFRDNVGQRLIDGRIDWRLGMRDELQLQFGQIDVGFQVGDGEILDPFRNQKQSQTYVQLGWRRALADAEDLAVRYYRSEEKAADAFNFSTVIGGFPLAGRVDYGFRSVRDDLEISHTFRPSRDTRLVWGGELRSDAVRAPMYYGRKDDVSLTVARLFGNLEWRPALAWVANFGATWEHDTNSKTTFAPRVAVNWHVVPGQTLRAGMTRAYRAPSLFETRGNWTYTLNTGQAFDRTFLAGGKLSPESLTSRELGWIGDFKPLRLTGDVRVFEERLADHLTDMDAELAPPYCELIPCGRARRMFNAEKIRIRGVEYQFRWQPIETTRVILNQSFVKISTDYLFPAGVAPGFNYSKSIMMTDNSAPSHASTFMLMQRLPGGFELSMTYYRVGEAKWTTSTSAPNWHRLDWRLGYPFRIGTTRGEVAFTVQSDGRPHIEHANNQGDPSRGEFVTTRGYATLRLDF